MTWFSIRPFCDNDLTDNPIEATRRKHWNRTLSSLRIFVEHAFGRLKGRFPILRAIPGRNLSSMYRLIEALLVVHNILETYGDDPTTIAGFNGREDDAVLDIHHQRQHRDDQVGEVNGDNLYRMGLLRQKLLVNLMEERML